jgi:hypothetical protein
MSDSLDIFPHQLDAYKRAPIPAEAAPYMGILLAAHLHDNDVSGFLRKEPDWSLEEIACAIVEHESTWPLTCEVFGAPYEGPSWSFSVVLPQIVQELERRKKPKVVSDNSLVAILKRLDIAVVAARYTDLKPAGHNRLKGKCPLHQEKTPSFYIYEDTQRWRCYGACASGGDVIDLLARLAGKRGGNV